MEFVIASGHPLKNFTRAVTCLTKFGENIDISATSREVKLSSVNDSRSAFGVVTFRSDFFARYHVPRQSNGSKLLSLSVNGKALLSPLRPRSANTIESCHIAVTDPDSATPSTSTDAGQCRIIVRLHCQHGIVKTHRLTYSACTALFARASRNQCTSSWLAPSQILKEWMDHFHLKTSATGAGSDEISFYHTATTCRLKSFAAENPRDKDPTYLSSRPLGTELAVETEAFDQYDVDGEPLITINLKELKAIIALAEACESRLDAAFSVGGKPFMIEVQSPDFKADFVIATTDYDSGSTQATGTQPAIKREPADNRGKTANRAMNAAANGPRSNQQRASNGARPSAASNNDRPLFNPASQQQGTDHDDDGGARGNASDEFDNDDGMDAFDDAAFAEIDRLSQAVSASQQVDAVSVRGPNGLLAPDTSWRPSEAAVLEVGHEDDSDAASDLGPTQVQPTTKKPRWNLLGD